LRRTRDAFAHCARSVGKFRQCAAREDRKIRTTSDSGSFTKAEIARGDVLQSSEMIGHGRGGQNLKCRIPPASNVKKKQEFA
jgi:hypothetical protein